ncbi:DNA repair protein RecN [Thermithiobacillus plumbiphilus]|uniref:DNA repair protein RecN n=1 Tax=Thermithiobacillus plumbiphilus TaxID=1729899 RepID=A0ABU9D9C0_9PROT
MLSHISIRDFAIIEKLHLDLAAGLTVLTGETGAGKSIIVDALSLVLGERADAGMVRHGAEQADISAEFLLPDGHPVLQLLESLELDEEGGCLLRRVVNSNGRSRAFVNGRPVPLQQLKQIGDRIADIYGQHAHQSLLQAEVQRELLDTYAGLGAELQDLRARYLAWQACRTELASLSQSQQDREARLELIRYQLEELEQINPQPDELDTLEQDRLRLSASHDLQTTASRALDQLYEGEHAVSDILGTLSRQLGDMSGVDARLGTVLTLIDDALIQVDEAATELRNYLGHLESDPGRLDEVIERLNQIQNLLRKHHCDYAGLLAKRDALVTERDSLENLSEALAQAENRLATAALAYRKTASQVSRARQQAAESFGAAVTGQMQQLGLPRGSFQVEVRAANPEDESSYRAQGLDQVSFLVNTNPGQPPRELAKVASGGELSRISLGIQVVLAGLGEVGTLVFDEVDVGVGGAVAEIVGRQLRQLGMKKQVFCITHQPQVAAQGHQHLQVSKTLLAEHTQSLIRQLDRKARGEELARMLGGVQITEQTRAMAMEMLEMAEKDSPALLTG